MQRSPLRASWGVSVALAVRALSALPAAAEPVPGGKGFVLDGIDNQQAPFAVRVGVDRHDAAYALGDEIKVTVRSDRDGHLYLLYVDADENVSCIFPNKVQRSNAIKAGEDVVIPAAGTGFKLRVSPPTGTEVLKALVTVEPLETMQHERLVAGDKTVLTRRDLQAVKGESSSRTDWADDDVTITTVARREPDRPARRHALVVGVAEHAEEAFPARPASLGDARDLAAALRETCRFDTVEMLVGRDATRERIRQALTVSLRNATAPGDTIVVAWSGRIARLPDDDGDEEGGCDTVFLPHDARGDDAGRLRGSGVADDDLCAWLRDLDGRTVVVLLDGCDDTALPPSVAGEVPIEAGGPLDREVARMADLGQRRLAVAAAIRPGETALVRPDGSASELTALFVERLRDADRPLTLAAAFAAVTPALATLAQERQSPASPSLVGDAGDAELVPADAPPADQARTAADRADPRDVAPAAAGGTQP